MSIVDSALGLLPGARTPESEEPPSARIDASPEEVFDLLGCRRRRLTIHAFAETDGPVELRHLATGIAAAENDCAPGELDTQQRKRVYVGLYQTHMSQLVEAGVVEHLEDLYGENVYRATPLADALDEIAAEVESRCAEEDDGIRANNFETVRETTVDLEEVTA